jgi:D-sedoheptulose 7-phosphate isomerase
LDPIFVELGTRYPALEGVLDDCQAAVDIICASMANAGTLYLCGNGGSAADSEHIAGELMKGFLSPRPLADQVKARLIADFADDGEYLAERLQRGLPAIALTSHTSIATAVINDQGGDLVYAQQLIALARPGDVLIGISTSGNAVNVQHAARVARTLGLKVIGLTGESGGELAALCHLTIRAPSSVTHIVQEFHLPIYHALCIALERHFFDLPVLPDSAS